MEHLVDSLGYLLKGHGPAYLNVFDTVTAPTFGPLLDASQPASLRWEEYRIKYVSLKCSFGGCSSSRRDLRSTRVQQSPYGP